MKRMIKCAPESRLSHKTIHLVAVLAELWQYLLSSNTGRGE